jgi:hypothetical protein
MGLTSVAETAEKYGGPRSEKKDDES